MNLCRKYSQNAIVLMVFLAILYAVRLETLTPRRPAMPFSSGRVENPAVFSCNYWYDKHPVHALTARWSFHRTSILSGKPVSGRLDHKS